MIHYRKHKIRFDRGRMWYAIFNSVITAILVTVFSSDLQIVYKILLAVATFVLIYLMGFVDEKFKLLDKEQSEYSKRNPYLIEMNNKLDEIIKKYD